MSNPLTNIIQNIKTTLETTTKEISTDEGDNESISIFNEDDNTTPAGITNCSAVLPIAIIPGIIEDLLDGESKDGEIGDTEQNQTGDCALLSGINALSYTEKGREIIKNALDYQDGYTIVHLTTGDVTVSDIEVTTTKGSSQYSSGDDDMIIFELAIEKTFDDIINDKIILDEDAPESILTKEDATSLFHSSVTGTWSRAVFYLLTGQEGIFTDDRDAINEQLDKYDENGNKDYVLTALSYHYNEDGELMDDIEVKDINGNNISIVGCHGYAVKSADGDTVTVTNPWDSSEEIVLSRETFLEAFTDTESVDLS